MANNTMINDSMAFIDKAIQQVSNSILWVTKPMPMYYGEDEAHRAKRLYKDSLAEGVYKGHRFMVCSILGAHPCGYVRLTDEDEKYDDEDQYGIDCHGGVTFAGEFKDYEGFWIGWDYAHFGDFQFYPRGSFSLGRSWNTEEVVIECLHVIDQLVN